MFETSGIEKSSSSCWPKEQLPVKIPSARVMSFGYDSTPWFSAYPIKDVLSAQGTELIDQLCRRRLETPKRPIVFVASGIGGLIMKSALVQSHMAITDQEERVKAIKLSTTGIALIGVPDLEASGRTVIPGVIEASDVRDTGIGNPRKTTVEDAAWLKLQLDGFQSIAQCFSTIAFYDSQLNSSRPWVPPLVSFHSRV
jgi:hypothetical protein